MLYYQAQETNNKGVQRLVEIGISFHHNTLNTPDEVNGITFCDITINGDRVATGKATCVEGDSFEKSTGRKLAMKRAMEEFSSTYTLEKKFKRNLWNVYFKNMK